MKTRQIHLRAILIAVSILFLAPFLARAENSKDIELLDRSARAFSRVVKDVKPAVVHIAVTSTVETNSEYEQFFNHPFFEKFFGPEYRFQDPQQRKRQQQGAGSGFIIDREGHILTNNHVVEKADKITVTLNDNSEVEATLIGTDPKSDVALIKIDVDHDLPVVDEGKRLVGIITERDFMGISGRLLERFLGGDCEPLVESPGDEDLDSDPAR